MLSDQGRVSSEAVYEGLLGMGRRVCEGLLGMGRQPVITEARDI